MSTDLFKTVNYNDGEGVSYGDQNDSQRFLAARLNDQILEKLIGNHSASDPEFGGANANVSTVWAYCLDIGQAYPRQGSANNKIKLAAGTLFQKIGNATGNEPTLLAYTFDGTNEFTLANGDATNPRVDMLQMSLSYVTDDLQSRDFEDGTTHVLSTQSMYKKRQVQCTLSIKQGTPAATPVYPTPDAGYVPIACVVVGATYTGTNAFKYEDTAGAEAVLHDLRMPVNIKPTRTYVEQSDPNGGVIYRTQTVVNATTTDNAPNTNGVTHTRGYDKWTIVASAQPVYFPLSFLRVGDVIMGWFMNLKKNTNNTATVTGKIVYQDTTGEHDAETAVTDNENAPGYTNQFVGTTVISVQQGRQYYWKFIPSGSVTPGSDELHDFRVSYKRLGVEGALMARCTRPKGRVIAVAVSSDLGSTSANKIRLCNDIAETGQNFVCDLSSIAETGATPKRHIASLSTIEAHPIFTAGPTITGNGTHNPPIWGNGKRCYEEANLLTETQPGRLACRFEFPSPTIDVYDVTFYLAEGL